MIKITTKFMIKMKMKFYMKAMTKLMIKDKIIFKMKINMK